MRNFREIKVWEKSHLLTLDIYRRTQNFPQEEKYGLTSQIRRAASSIPTNIAEGCGRKGEKELARFMQISMGSASETEYLLLLSFELGIITKSQYIPLNNQIVEIKRMLSSFIKRLRR